MICTEENNYQEFQVKTTELPLYQPFHVYGFQVMSAGTNKSKFGCIIGIPINFNYNNIEKDADEIPIMVRNICFTNFKVCNKFMLFKNPVFSNLC